MADAEEIADDEVILRHIPPGTTWQAPGPRVTSVNFRLRHDKQETGVSVTRQRFTSADELLRHAGGSLARGSGVASLSAGEVRALGLRVVPRPLPTDAGHAEIQSDSASLDSPDVRKLLAAKFQLLPTMPPAAPSTE